MDVLTPQAELNESLKALGWTLKSVRFSAGTYVAKATNTTTGQDVERNGTTPEMAVAAVYSFAQRANSIRTYAHTKLAAWNDQHWIDKHNEIGAAYSKLPPYDAKAAEAWQALAAESKVQADAIRQQIRVEVVDEPEPYASAQEMQDDIHLHQRLKVSRATNGHPVWPVEDLINYRIVHDVLGHAQSGGDWSWNGENKAAAAHMPLVSPLAREALFSEIIGNAAYKKVHHGHGPHKIGFLSEFLQPAQAKEGEHVFVPHGGMPNILPAEPSVLGPTPGEWIPPPNFIPSPMMGTPAVMQGYEPQGSGIKYSPKQSSWPWQDRRKEALRNILTTPSGPYLCELCGEGPWATQGMILQHFISQHGLSANSPGFQAISSSGANEPREYAENNIRVDTESTNSPGVAPDHVASLAEDPNAHFVPRTQAPPVNPTLTPDSDYIGISKALAKADTINTEWHTEEEAIQEQALLNSFRNSLLLQMKQGKWNSSNYQALSTLSPSLPASDLLYHLESTREKHDNSIGYPSDFSSYSSQLKYLANSLDGYSKTEAHAVAKGIIFNKTKEFEGALKPIMSDEERFKVARKMVSEWIRKNYKPAKRSGWKSVTKSAFSPRDFSEANTLVDSNHSNWKLSQSPLFDQDNEPPSSAGDVEVYVLTPDIEYDREIVAIMAELVGDDDAQNYDSGSGPEGREMHFTVPIELAAYAVTELNQEPFVLKAEMRPLPGSSNFEPTFPEEWTAKTADAHMIIQLMGTIAIAAQAYFMSKGVARRQDFDMRSAQRKIEADLLDQGYNPEDVSQAMEAAVAKGVFNPAPPVWPEPGALTSEEQAEATRQYLSTAEHNPFFDYYLECPYCGSDKDYRQSLLPGSAGRNKNLFLCGECGNYSDPDAEAEAPVTFPEGWTAKEAARIPVRYDPETNQVEYTLEPQEGTIPGYYDVDERRVWWAGDPPSSASKQVVKYLWPKQAQDVEPEEGIKLIPCPRNIPIEPERIIEYPDWTPDEEPLKVPEEWPEEAPEEKPEKKPEKEPAKVGGWRTSADLPFSYSPEAGYGWKILLVDEDGTFVSPSQGTRWPVGQPLIEPNFNAETSRVRNNIGIHTVEEGNWDELYNYYSSSSVLVKCKLFGAVAEQEGVGHLSGKAMPVLAVAPDKELLLKVANKYGIDTHLVGEQNPEPPIWQNEAGYSIRPFSPYSEGEYKGFQFAVGYRNYKLPEDAYELVDPAGQRISILKIKTDKEGNLLTNPSLFLPPDTAAGKALAEWRASFGDQIREPHSEYQEKHALLDARRGEWKYKKKLQNNTYLWRKNVYQPSDDNPVHVQLHNTNVVSFHPHHFELDNGGWPTVTTKDRMRGYMPSRFDLHTVGEGSWNKPNPHGGWYIYDRHTNETYPYSNGMAIDYEHGPIGVDPYEVPLKKRGPEAGQPTRDFWWVKPDPNWQPPTTPQTINPKVLPGQMDMFSGWSTTWRRADVGVRQEEALIPCPRNIPIDPDKIIEYPDWTPNEEPLKVPEEWPEEKPEKPEKKPEKEPAKVGKLSAEGDVPFYFSQEPGYGWKILKVDSDGTLISPSQGTRWPVGQPLIEPNFNVQEQIRNQRGIHTVHEGNWRELYSYYSDNSVLVKLKLFGAVAEQEGVGHLSGKAMPILAVSPNKDLLLKVANKYGIDTELAEGQENEALIVWSEEYGLSLDNPSSLSEWGQVEEREEPDLGATIRIEDGGQASFKGFQFNRKSSGGEKYYVYDERGEELGSFTYNDSEESVSSVDVAGSGQTYVKSFFDEIRADGKNPHWNPEYTEREYADPEYSDWRDSDSIDDWEDLIKVWGRIQDDPSYYSEDLEESDYEYEWSEDTDEYGLRWEVAYETRYMAPRIDFDPTLWMEILEETLNSIFRGDYRDDQDSYVELQKIAEALVGVPKYMSEGEAKYVQNWDGDATLFGQGVATARNYIANNEFTNGPNKVANDFLAMLERETGVTTAMDQSQMQMFPSVNYKQDLDPYGEEPGPGVWEQGGSQSGWYDPDTGNWYPPHPSADMPKIWGLSKKADVIGPHNFRWTPPTPEQEEWKAKNDLFSEAASMFTWWLSNRGWPRRQDEIEEMWITIAMRLFSKRPPNSVSKEEVAEAIKMAISSIVQAQGKDADDWSMDPAEDWGNTWLLENFDKAFTELPEGLSEQIPGWGDDNKNYVHDPKFPGYMKWNKALI